MAGKFIVIEGLDGSGKATQTEILKKSFESEGKKVKKLTFPDYDNLSSALVKMYLGGEFGDNPDDVNAYAAAAFYTVDRIASYLKFWKEDYENGSYILADRYATSNIIYQMSKLPKSEWDDYIAFQEDFEYNKIKVPKPDLVVYLDVEPDVSQKLMSKRYAGDENKKDLHEKNVNFLLECRKSALYAADKLGWVKVSCTENGEMKTIEEIADEIKAVIINRM
ncbi:MAG: dTMP kinase [Ruminococcus sp.]|nr:dTMP kinase [Ruminococcus sp.]